MDILFQIYNFNAIYQILYYVYFSSAVVQSTEAVSNIPSDELVALKDFYYATNGDSWRIFGTAWNFTGTPNPCVDNWWGLSCTCTTNTSGIEYPYDNYGDYVYYYDDNVSEESYNCSVQKIFLGFSELEGTIPQSIGNLTALTHLHLEQNNLVGSLPTSFKYLTALSHLYLQDNQLNGSLSLAVEHLPVSLVRRLNFVNFLMD